MRNSGIEFMLSGTLLKTKDVIWNMTLMGTHQRNKVEKLTGESNQIPNGVQIIKEGYDITTFYLAKSAGVDPATGAQLYWAYESMDDDGNAVGEYITSDYSKAQSSRYFAGKRTPDLYGSISTDLQLFNCVDLSIMTTYSIGGKIYDSKYDGSMQNLYAGYTWSSNALRRWQNPGDITDIPRIELGGTAISNDRFLIDASYFAIKNITVGYTFPTRLTGKVSIKSCRLFFTADNVALFSHLGGMDPQQNFTGGVSYSYTPAKAFVGGIELNF
jgi:hypothetical protein